MTVFKVMAVSSTIKKITITAIIITITMIIRIITITVTISNSNNRSNNNNHSSNNCFELLSKLPTNNSTQQKHFARE